MICVVLHGSQDVLTRQNRHIMYSVNNGSRKQNHCYVSGAESKRNL